MEPQFEPDTQSAAISNRGSRAPARDDRLQHTDATQNTSIEEQSRDPHGRRSFLLAVTATALMGGLTRVRAHEADEATGVPVPVKVRTKGVSAVIKYEAVVAGFLSELNGRYKLRVTEITIAPGGVVGDHNHLGPGIREVTEGEMEYIMPDKTVVYGPGAFFFEAGNVSHRVENRGGMPCTHLLFEILPLAVSGPSLIPPRDLR